MACFDEATNPEDSPVLFNPLKHHARYLTQKIRNISGEMQLIRLAEELESVNHNVIDLYTGRMPVHSIVTGIERYLSGHDLLDSQLYKQWIIASSRSYRIIYLRDKSSWTLKTGHEQKKYIHVHPSRYSYHSIRVRGLTLKTAVMALAWQHFKKRTHAMADINEIRVNYLSASPIKTISNRTGIGALMRRLNELAYEDI